MSRPGLVVSFVMLFLFFEAQGIRLEKGFQYYYSVDDHQRLSINVETNKMMSTTATRLLEVHEAKGDDAASSFEDLCRNGQCLSGSRTRKLLSKGTSTTSTTTSTTSSLSNSSKQVVDHVISKQQESSKRLIKGNNINGKFLVESKLTSEHREVVPAVNHYPDIIDIAGMDYTTARRKSPIHN